MTVKSLVAQPDPRVQLNHLVRDLDRLGPSLDAAPSVPEQALHIATAARVALRKMLSDDRLRNVESLSPSDVADLLDTLRELCTKAQHQSLLAQNNIVYPIYNNLVGYDDNTRGPWGSELSPPITTPIAWRLLGVPLRFPIGVPASSLTSSHEWIGYYARRGFNVVTYKTVRSREFKAHLFPNWVFLSESGTWASPNEVSAVHGDLDTWPSNIRNFSSANSFGVPSPPPEVWQRDVEKSLGELSDGQLLIVSVMGSEGYGPDGVRDFVRVARLAEDAGARAIELNVSCPNTVENKQVGQPVCFHPAETAQIVQAVREGLRNNSTKLVAKLTCMPTEILTEVIDACSRALDGVSGINTVQAEVRKADNRPVFVGTADDPKQERLEAGVSGSLIRQLGLDFVCELSRLRAERDASFDIIGMGGVMSVHDVKLYRDAGADCVQTATGAAYNTLLAVEAESELISAADDPSQSRRDAIRRLFATGGLSALNDPRLFGRSGRR